VGGVPGVSTDTGLRQSCEGTIFYVDPNHVDCHDQRDGTNPTSPLATVAAALTKCEAYKGDMIVVMDNGAWQYGTQLSRLLPIQESVVVTVPGVKIVGMAPASSLGVVWSPTVTGATAIEVRTTDVLIEGFAFYGVFDPAIHANYIGYYGDNMTVRHCYFGENVDIAIALEYAWNCDIHDNWFFEVDEKAITNVDPANPAAYNSIHDNYFDDVGVTAVDLATGVHNKIWSNQLWNSNAAVGIAAVDCFITTAGGARNYVHDNTLSCLFAGGLSDYPVTCTPDAAAPNTTDCWVNNHCLEAMSTGNP